MCTFLSPSSFTSMLQNTKQVTELMKCLLRSAWGSFPTDLSIIGGLSVTRGVAPCWSFGRLQIQGDFCVSVTFRK